MTTITSPPHILVVDDEAGIRYFLQRALTRDGYQVVAADSGEAALERIAAQEFDLVLVDLKMKGVGGMQVLAALRRQWPETSVIVITAHASLETAVEALRQGAHDYLFKPCKTVELRESVRAGLSKRREALQRRDLLNRLAPALSAAPEGPLPATSTMQLASESADDQGRFLQYKGLIVDSIRHIITVDGQLLELSPTEFGLLAYLVGEAPRVVPPQELVREVQGYESESQEACETVRSHVYHVRQKARAATGRGVIRNVRGIGYTLDD